MIVQKLNHSTLRDRCSNNQVQGNTDNSSNPVQGSSSSNVNQVSKWVVNLSIPHLPQPNNLFCLKDLILPLPPLILPMWSLFQQLSWHPKGFWNKTHKSSGWKSTPY